MARQYRVVDYIVEHLAAIDVTHIFGVDGANIEDVYDAAHFRSDITAVLAKHEFSAAAMADGFSRSGAGLGVVVATSGGGALNVVPGLGESLASRVPVLALIGQPSTALDGRGSFQDLSGRNGALDAEALFSAVSLYCHRVTEPADIVPAMSAAIAAARSGGPAVLLLPKNIQQAKVNCTTSSDCHRWHHQIGDPRPIARALRNATGPVTIIAGEQVARDDARAELEQLRSMLRARIATVPDAKDVAGTPGLGSSSGLGVTGVMGHPGVAEAVAGSGMCLVVGTRLSVTARAGLEEALASVPTVSLGSAAPYVPCTHVYTDNLRGSLSLLILALTGAGRPTGIRVPDRVTRTELTPPPFDGPGVRYRDAMRVLDDVLPAGVDIVVDAGNTGASAIHYLPVRRDGRFVVALGMGGMGYSFGAGLGMAFGAMSARAAMSRLGEEQTAAMSRLGEEQTAAMSRLGEEQTAHRQRPSGGDRVVVIAGDGAFFMHGMEIHTALQYRLPVTFVLFNNNAHAMCVTREQLFYDDLYSYNRFDPANLGAGLAAMFPGLPSVDVLDVGDLADGVRSALSVDGPSVVSVECAADEVPPFAAFLTEPAANSQGVNHHSIIKENSRDVVART